MSDYRVLLVDDEEELVSTLAERLGYRGFSAKYTTNGARALEMLSESPFDAVVVDLKLPGMSGEELLRAIRSNYPGLPVLMVTGHGPGEESDHAKPPGAFDFLMKPVSIDELVSKMTKAIEASNAR